MSAAYAAVVTGESSGCCGSQTLESISSTRLGYTASDLKQLPEGADLGVGCGSPVYLAQVQPGETVLDLGSGAGVDCFLSLIKMGGHGKVIGVDMTKEMIAKSRKLAADRQFTSEHVEFRLGEIEALPVANDSVDVVISNCVVNLSTDKARVFRECFRALKPGGRIAISDVVQRSSAPLPAAVKQDVMAYCSCVGGASTKAEVEQFLTAAGFTDVQVQFKEESREFIKDWVPGSGLENHVVSANVTARKPAAACGLARYWKQSLALAVPVAAVLAAVGLHLFASTECPVAQRRAGR